MSRTKYTFSRRKFNPEFSKWENFGYWSGVAVLCGIVFWIGYEIVKHV